MKREKHKDSFKLILPKKEKGKGLFKLILTEVGGNKIACIILIRKYVEIGLKECKELTDIVQIGKEPQVILAGISRSKAIELQKKFKEIGATTLIAH